MVELHHGLAAQLSHVIFSCSCTWRAVAVDIGYDDLVDDWTAVGVVVASFLVAALFPDICRVEAFWIGVGESGATVVVVCRGGAGLMSERATVLPSTTTST